MPRKSPVETKKRAARIVRQLRRLYPDATTALNYRDPLQLLVATILSAQCTDERVNRVTPALFAKYKTAADYAAADPAVFEQEIRSTGFFRNKAKSIRAACRDIADRFAGRVPDTMEELTGLPGVGRKTANVVLGTAFDIAAGVAVDTHVARLAQRLGLSKFDQPDKIEPDLTALFDRGDWTFLGHALILHGRRVCAARRPDCAACPLADDCPAAFTFPHNRRV